jgi:SAM-dependent methyltransferase
MFKNILGLVVCPYCHRNLTIVKLLTSDSAIFSCLCDQYPLVEGILYMKKDEVKKKLINKIVRRQGYLHLFAFSFQAHLFFRLIVFKIAIIFLSFKKMINFIILLGFPKEFAKYILSRNYMPSFFLGLLSFDLIDRSDTVLEIGCAMGQFLPFFYNHCRPSNLISIDKDFFSLYLAKNYFAKKNATLICFDLSIGFPIKKKSIDNFFIVDTLHYIKDLGLFLKNLRNISKSSAEGAIIHTLNIQVDSPHPCYKRRPSYLMRELKVNGFKNINILSNVNLWDQLNKSEKITLSKEKNINMTDVFNIIFTKRKVLKFNYFYQQLLKNTEVDYYQDAYLGKQVGSLSNKVY